MAAESSNTDPLSGESPTMSEQEQPETTSEHQELQSPTYQSIGSSLPPLQLPSEDTNDNHNNENNHELSESSAQDATSAVATGTGAGEGEGTSSTTTTNTTSGDASAPATVSLIPPSLRGRFVTENGRVLCRGKWALTDEQHDIPGLSSDFEFKLIQHQGGILPYCGKYSGWFTMKYPNKVLKFDDRDMFLNFSAREGGGYDISGTGTNKVGKYTLNGYLREDGTAQMYRVYAPKPLPVPPQSKKKNDSSATKSVTMPLATTPTNGATNAISRINLSSNATTPVMNLSSTNNTINNSSIITTPSSTSTTQAVTPRESTGRVRKLSLQMKEYEESVAATTPRTKASKASKESTPGGTGSSNSSNYSIGGSGGGSATTPVLLTGNVSTLSQVSYSSNNSSHNNHHASSRSQRMPASLVKCSELLKEMSKLPAAYCFLEPVDVVALNIPDYLTIITNPMDFRTIRENLDSGRYESHEQFAEHMRLVFRNAVTYNQFRDHPVNIAAREVSAKFEERYRALASQPTYHMAALYDANEAKISGIGGGSGGGGGSKKSKSPRPSLGRSAVPSTAAIPRGMVPAVSPRSYAGIDPHLAQVADLQKQILQMQSEMVSLKTQLGQQVVQSHIEQQRDAAKNPLSFQEKKELIERISRLSSDKSDKLINIIRTSMPSYDGDEIDLDSLDTLTMRRLKQFVDNCSETKASSSLSRSVSTSSLKSSTSQAPKKPKATGGSGGGSKPKSSLSSNNLAANNSQSMSMIPNDELLADDDMLFNFEDEEVPETKDNHNNSNNEETAKKLHIEQLREQDRIKREQTAMTSAQFHQTSSLVGVDDDLFG